MSSRLLRRAQKELEERQRLERLAQPHEEEPSEEEVTLPSRPKPSLFALLGEASEAGDGNEDDVEPEVDSLDSEGEATPAIAPAPLPSKKSKKKKKKKKKGKDKAQVNDPPNATPSSTSPKIQSGLDEIDRALLALNITSQANCSSTADQLTSTVSDEMQQLYAVLAIDTQHLQASNEMRKLFGRAAVQGGNDDEPARLRQRGRGQLQVGIAANVAARNAPGSRNLSIGLRRNIFVQGKEEWPRATLGGLGMEVVEKRNDGAVEYRFVHNFTYQSVQRQFETCVASMDPEQMIQLLHFNPYHISTLLQVSEIAKQQRDNATAGDLLERALFSFGRAVHSTFATNLSQGKARLDFRRPENREFWLAAWRHICVLGTRATWRTAFEWAKLLLSMDPEGDPYCIRLVIDQLALRGRQPQSLINIVDADHLQRIWKIAPNLAMSIALAYDHLKDPEKARSSLRLAIQQYPWIAARLCKELEISPIPKPIWGKEPNDDHQKLLCQLYVPRAKDLWNTPEATSLLVEVASSLETLGSGENPSWLRHIDEVHLARHVILLDDRELLSFLEPRVINKYTSTSDPLPPEDNKSSYTVTTARQQNAQNVNEDQLRAELEVLREYFVRLDLSQHIAGQDLTVEMLRHALRDAGTSYEEFRRNTERVQTLRARLQELGIRVVFAEEDGEDTDSDTDEE
ncbi:DUF654-domain-containing protein [Lindgomyces ingoldianus]|uniref:DUF654-domain-containing protein n=1 Tax=Lindgomyces ingoldianus TaxID=673940 RepID=A0ACB6QXS7_9PLEO|nr:DUF654-domain-containing protein [Lindgomyces ingoldianus]KAF2471617.1 DUF654-domain-containing protein [Lindgomyces ingoldianus]